MNTLTLVMGIGGIVLQILISLNRVLKRKEFDLKYWWSHNRVATITAILSAVTSIYLMNLKGVAIDQATELIVTTMIGYITGSVSHHTLREKSKK